MLERVRAWWRRWCATPRPYLWNGTGHPLKVFFVLMTGTAWLGFAQGTVALVTGGADPSGGRGLAAAVYALVALALAVAGTVFVTAYLRRPMLPEDRPPPPGDDPNSPEAIAAREQAARRLGSWRRTGI
ncbi:MAG TPA: hypothetical protein VNA20_02200 [Frankiaceae bacterium]|nr:hypothetical protein [Frankiaceae bacterium]